MFGRKIRKADFEREVDIEIEILTKIHGQDAARVAREKAVRPTNRTHRRRVLEEAVRRLDERIPPAQPRASLMTKLFGS
jgi:hypothetical protein